MYATSYILQEDTILSAGQKVRVRTTCELASVQPRYSFRVDVEKLSPDGSERAGAAISWRALGAPILYPEASLNVNDMMDLLMEQMMP